MAKKPDITTIASGYYSRQALNTNFENLQDGFDNTLSLDGSTPNSMGADFDVNGNNILNAGQIDTDSLLIGGVAVASGDVSFETTYLTASYTGDGSTVAYSLTANPQTENNVNIYVDGVYQNKTTFSLSGTTVTFSEAPPLNAAIEIVYPTNTDTLNGSNATAITYNQGGTGAQDRNVAQKLQEFVSVKDFGAVGDGVTDDTAAVKAAMQYASSVSAVLHWPSATYLITSGVSGTTDSISTLIMKMSGAVIKFNNTGFHWLTDIDVLRITGGTIGQSGSELNGDFASIYYTATKSELFLENVAFNVGTTQAYGILSDEGFGPNELYINKCDFRNFTKYGIDLPIGSEGNLEARAIIENSYFKNIGRTSSSTTHRAIKVGSNTNRAQTVTVSNCRVEDVASGNSDANAILVYGNGVVIDGNHVENVSNTKTDDAEAIYVKATNARITNNYVLDGGYSHDGCIGIKGIGWDNDDQESGYSVISNNTVELTDTAIDVPAITINKSHVICSNNVLKDLRSNRSSKDYAFALGIGTSQAVSDVIVSNNIINGFKDVFSDDPDYPTNIVDDVIITNNVCTDVDGGVALAVRFDGKVSNTMTFTASSNTIAFSTASGVGFSPDTFHVGDTITVAGTSSNNGDYTIATISQYSMTVSSGITDEASVANTEITREDPNGVMVLDNIFSFASQGDYGFYKRCGSNPKLIKFTGNILRNINRGIRSTTGTAEVFDMRDTVFQSVTDEIYTTISATDIRYYSPDSSGTTGGSGSAGSGNQYVELDIDGTTYKVLHDGTV